MSTLQEISQGVEHAWDTLIAGWRHFSRRAAHALTRFNPLAARGEGVMREEADTAARSAGWGVLAAEVFDDDARVVVRIEAPGMERGDFIIQVVDDVLVVQGEKRSERERTQGRYHVLECAYGRFERAIELPAAVDSDAATATYRKGVLTVELPRAIPAGGRSIKVNVG